MIKIDFILPLEVLVSTRLSGGLVKEALLMVGVFLDREHPGPN